MGEAAFCERQSLRLSSSYSMLNRISSREAEEDRGVRRRFFMDWMGMVGWSRSRPEFLIFSSPVLLSASERVVVPFSLLSDCRSCFAEN